MKLTIQGKVYTYDRPQVLLDVANQLSLKNMLAATVNGRLRELSYIETKDADVEFLGYDHPDAIRMYESTLRYVIAMAIKRILPSVKVRFNYSISRSILAVLDNYDGPINQALINVIKDEVDRLIKADLNMPDKVSIMEHREEDYVNLYECDGYINYMFGYMLPKTGLLSTYNLFSYHPGFIIQYPRAELGGKIPEFHDEPTFGKALKEAAKWGKIIEGNTIPKINDYAKDFQSAVDFVNMCETKHNHQLNELGDLIQSNIDNIRLIGIAGPSSSGKTIRLGEDTPIIIEGIHALNEKLTRSIPKHQKFQIYIAPQTQLHIDDHNPISITELRLLRRIVRDQKYRNSSAIDTMNMWPSVRRGEFKWIYPFQKEANYVFNSELTYELAVLKKHAVTQLQAIPRDNKHFITANRLLKFLKYFKHIEDEIVPCNSLLREFIGGSSFHH